MSLQPTPPVPGLTAIPNFAKDYTLVVVPFFSAPFTVTTPVGFVGLYSRSLRLMAIHGWSYSGAVGCRVNCDYSPIPNGAEFWAFAGLPAANPPLEDDELYRLRWRLHT